MRILIMVNSLTGGGAERAASLWAKGFVDRRHQVGIVLNCRKSVPITYQVPESVNIYNIWSYFTCKYVFDSLKEKLLSYKIKSIFDLFMPDVVIGVERPWAERAYIAAKDRNIQIINTEHNSFERPVDSPMDERDILMKYEWNRHYNHVTVLTEADKRCVDSILNNVSVLPNPLSFIPIDEVPHKERIILAVGRLSSWYVKGFDVLINAWGRIACSYPDWKLIIAGGGKKHDFDKMKQMADKYSISQQIEFSGFKEDILYLYKKAAIFVFPSRYDGFGMALLEAMSQGCAPIACDFKGRQREIITKEDEGTICPTDDVDSLSSAIQKLIDDGRLRISIQKGAIKRSRLYMLDNIMDKWDFIIKTIIEKNDDTCK